MNISIESDISKGHFRNGSLTLDVEIASPSTIPVLDKNALISSSNQQA